MVERALPQQRVGRPRRDARRPEVRARLLEAATRLAAERGMDRLTIREIAKRASVTPAMVAYYFGSKDELLTAVFDSTCERLIRRVGVMADALQPEDDAIAAFIDLNTEMLAQEPYTHRILLREVLASDGPLRRRFVERYVQRGESQLRAFFEHEQRAGRLRPDLDPALGILSIMGMTAFPFLAHPLFGEALAYAPDEDFARRLAAHTRRLFAEGAHRAQETA
ncbi:MAG: TetR/AcrR family transcriptional regulator [Proteobacteria bacterium]|nr:TetR/AcrR family transcriptional regulator [Pseudomonadota bacterium]